MRARGLGLYSRAFAGLQATGLGGVEALEGIPATGLEGGEALAGGSLGPLAPPRDSRASGLGLYVWVPVVKALGEGEVKELILFYLG